MLFKTQCSKVYWINIKNELGLELPIYRYDFHYRVMVDIIEAVIGKADINTRQSEPSFRHGA